MNFGIDAISFSTSKYYIDIRKLEIARGIIGSVPKSQDEFIHTKMAISPPNEDIVTFAANAVWNLLRHEDKDCIEMVIFATETGVDFSKAAAVYIHKLFDLPKRCRVIELKQACYSATFGLQMGLTYLQQYPNKKILLIASDVARYEFNTIAEMSQGCGAVAMLLSANPRILEIDPRSGFYTTEVMDFWRPNYSDTAFVDGRLSCDTYIKFAEETWSQYSKLTGHKFIEHDHFCYHTPLAKLVLAAHKKLARINGIKLTSEQIKRQLGDSLAYSREIGNCYTASLYLGIISLLENSVYDLTGKLLGLYSYGSGSSGEFIGAKVVSGYKDLLADKFHWRMLQSRQEISIEEYEGFYRYSLPTDGGFFELPKWQAGKFRLHALSKHQRIYIQTT